MEPPKAEVIPSWLRWPPNCCETCIGPWIRHSDWVGKCEKPDSLEYGTPTDARFRCPSFQRKPDAKPIQPPVE